MNTKEIIDSLESIQNNLREQKESLLKLKEVCTDAPPTPVGAKPYEIRETEDDHHYFLERSSRCCCSQLSKRASGKLWFGEVTSENLLGVFILDNLIVLR